MNIQITGRGVTVTTAIKDAVEKMISKHEKFLEKATKIEVELKDNTSYAGVKSDVGVEVTISMPKVFIRVEELGEDFYAVIDQIDPILRRRLVRYRENMKKWEGKESWKLADKKRFEEQMDEGTAKDDTYEDASFDVHPIITRKKEFSRNSPMHPEEAIERMELLDHEAFLFKNIETGKYSMVYRKRDGTYGLVEPKEV